MSMTGRIRHMIALFVLASLLPPIIGCGAGTGVTGADKPKPAELGQLPERLDRFAFKFFRRVNSEDAGKNVFVSPPGLELDLAMVLNGAGGATLQQMQDALELGGMTLEDINSDNAALLRLLKKVDPKVTVEVADSLWGAGGVTFNEEFLKRCTDYYDAEVRSVDLTSASGPAAINKWVSEKTHGKITKIVEPPMDPLSVLVLLNAIYFNGKWSVPFDEKRTRDRDFFSQTGGAKKVPMMSQSGEFEYTENGDFQAVRLPYGQGKASMYVFLPKAPDGLEGLLGSLNPENWNAWLAGLQESKGDLELPRFRMEYDKSLNDTLRAMGMDVPFTNRADFSGMVSGASADMKLFINKVRQKTYVDVNEKGTEAAAVTSTEMKATGAPPSNTFKMVVDHPFFFAIRDDETGVILFMGAVRDL